MQNITPPIPQSNQKPDRRMFNDANGDRLDLLRTAGIFVGAFVGVSNMLSIKSLHAKGFAQQSQQIQQRVRTVSICKDNVRNGGPLPAVPLANCKACRSKETYGASYNAAAHLRCAHFNTGRIKRGGHGMVGEGQADMGARQEPPMGELKN